MRLNITRYKYVCDSWGLFIIVTPTHNITIDLNTHQIKQFKRRKK